MVAPDQAPGEGVQRDPRPAPSPPEAAPAPGSAVSASAPQAAAGEWSRSGGTIRYLKPEAIS